MIWADIAPALPEIFMACAILFLLVVGVSCEKVARHLHWGAVAAILVTMGLVCHGSTPEGALIFNGGFAVDHFSDFIKSILLAGAAIVLLMGAQYAQRTLGRFEYSIVIMLATLGTMLMASANDMLTLYVGLELQSLALYVLAAFNRDNPKSSESGLKYFVLGALSSGILLFGISLVYGVTGMTNFDSISAALGNGAVSPVMLVGFVFILAGLAFKISAAPFHMWVPDVYEGAPTSVTAFFAAVPKVAAFALLLRVLFDAFTPIAAQWQPIIMVLAVLSMAVGSFAALKQTNIKRLMAYSSIGHVGYALVGVAAGTQAGIQGVLVYLAIYFIMTLGVFAIILSMRQEGKQLENISDLAGIGKTQPIIALSLAVLMFSMAGVPPLAGFFGKFYVFMAAIQQGLYGLAITGVVLSAVSAYYYLRLIKIAYFDEPTVAIDPIETGVMRGVLAVTIGYLVVFAFTPGAVLESSGKAALSLLG